MILDLNREKTTISSFHQFLVLPKNQSHEEDKVAHSKSMDFSTNGAFIVYSRFYPLFSNFESLKVCCLFRKEIQQTEKAEFSPKLRLKVFIWKQLLP